MSSTLPILIAGENTPNPTQKLPGILDVPTDTLRAWLAERKQPPMRVNQIRRQILANRAMSFDEMSDLPKELRAELATAFSVFSTSVEKHLFAMSDDTHKLVLRLSDDRMIECVLIQDDGRATACISTQVGCGMGCVFCASGLNGVVRNLTVGEMVEQLVRLRNLTDAKSTNPERAPRLTHIVAMGMGEPPAPGSADGSRSPSPATRTGYSSVNGTSRFPPSGCRRRSANLPTPGSNITSPSPRTHPPTRARRSCPPTTRLAFPRA
ncbi:MAG: hypothetical protein U0792_24700 [Gemmataceae bacterium]